MLKKWLKILCEMNLIVSQQMIDSILNWYFVNKNENEHVIWIHTICTQASVQLMQMLPLAKSTQLHHIPNTDRFFVQREPIAKDELFLTIRLMWSSVVCWFFFCWCSFIPSAFQRNNSNSIQSTSNQTMTIIFVGSCNISTKT